MIAMPLLDTIHINFVDEFDHDISRSSNSVLPTYQYYKKISEFFKFFDLDIKAFVLQRLSQKFRRQFSCGIYVEIKTFALKGQTSIPEIKLCSVQFKGLFFLKVGYTKLQAFLALYHVAFNLSISKIEVALDINKDFVFESMKLALKHRLYFIKMKSPKFIFNFTNKTYESLSMENTVNILKIYSKSEELKLKYNAEKKSLYYSKNLISEAEPITRIEVGFKNKQHINQATILDIAKMTESDYSLSLFKEFFSKIQILKKSKIKSEIAFILDNN